MWINILILLVALSAFGNSEASTAGYCDFEAKYASDMQELRQIKRDLTPVELAEYVQSFEATSTESESEFSRLVATVLYEGFEAYESTHIVYAQWFNACVERENDE